MRVAWIGAVLSLTAGAGAVGCSGTSSSHGTDTTMCEAAGSYLATGTTQSGTCAGTTSPVADTFAMVSGGMLNLMFEGSSGSGCTGPLNGCEWTCSTVLMESDALDPTKASLSLQYDYTFNDAGLTGTLTETADPAATLPSGCSGVIAVTASRQ